MEIIQKFRSGKLIKLIKPHVEWVAFLSGLILMATMNPSTDGFSFCLFDAVGLDICIGDGLGHSIAYLFRGDFSSALEANFMGPVAVIVLTSRIIHIWKYLFFKKNDLITGTNHA